MLTDRERVLKGKPKVCRACGWNKVLGDRWECVNPHCVRTGSDPH